MAKIKNDSHGQVLLITLLVLAIATTVALSAIGRSTTNLAITSQIDESSRAFNAAEAGIEEALKSQTGTSGSVTLAPGVSYTVNRQSVGGAIGVFEFPKKTTQSNVETLWLVNHNAQDGTLIEQPTYTSPSLDICWSNETIKPAIVTTILYKTAGGAYQIAKAAFDPDSSRRATDNFNAPQGGGSCSLGGLLANMATLTFSNFTPTITPSVDTLLAVRIMPLFSDSSIAVGATSILPLQGAKLESSGTTADGLTRKIVVYQQYKAPSSVFDNVIYSQGSFGH